MTAVPTTHTFSAGEVVTDTTLNGNVTNVLNFLLARPILRARQTVAQSIGTGGAGTALTFDAEDVDSSGMHSTVTNTSRATAVYPGWYLFAGNGSLVQNATGLRTLSWNVNSVAQSGAGSSDGGAGVGIDFRHPAASSLFFLNVNDFVEMILFQNSGGAVNTEVSGSQQSTMICVWESN
jgi:hypothetical protein